MNDIYDIKEIMLWFPIDIVFTLLFILFLICLYVIYLYKFKKSDIEKETLEKPVIIKIKKDFNKILKNFIKNDLDLETTIFHSKLLWILREILEEKEKYNISKMTFEEINNLNISEKLKDLIKSIYYKEYMKEVDDSLEIRKKYINEIKKIIK